MSIEFILLITLLITITLKLMNIHIQRNSAELAGRDNREFPERAAF